MEEDTLSSSDFYKSQRSHISVQACLLHDTPVIEKFKQIFSNPQIIEGKNVLEIGAGTGLFSMIAAKEGKAKHVYSWEPSKMSIYTKENIRDNNLEDKVSVLTGPFEELQIEDQIDIIFTATFNFGLVFESLYSDFVKAKEKFGTDSTIVFPSNISLFVCGATKSMLNIPNYWDKSVYGFDYKAMKTMNDNLAETLLMAPCRICTNNCNYLNIKTNEKNDPFTLGNSFELTVTKDGNLQSLVTWFDLHFSIDQNNEVVISTSPYEIDTHWVQLDFPLPHIIDVKAGDKIHGSITSRIINKFSRPILFDINLAINSQESQKLQFVLQ